MLARALARFLLLWFAVLSMVWGWSRPASATGFDSPCCEGCEAEVPQPPTPWVLDCNEVCKNSTVAGEEVVECDLERTSGSYTGRAVVIYDAAGAVCGAGAYCAWGNDVTGASFSCSWGTFDDTLSDVVVLGSDNTDYVYFSQVSGQHLDVYPTFAGTMFRGRVFGDDSTDWIVGSRSTDSHYIDILHGDNDDDRVCALDGDDIAEGDDGDDLVCGDNGDDVVRGATGADYLCGGNHADQLEGGGHVDTLDHGTDPGDTNDGGPPSPGDVCNGGGSDLNCTDLLGDGFCG